MVLNTRRTIRTSVRLTTAVATLAWRYVESASEPELACVPVLTWGCAKYAWRNIFTVAGATHAWRHVKETSKHVLTWGCAKYGWLTLLLLRAGDVETNPGPGGTGKRKSKTKNTVQVKIFFL